MTIQEFYTELGEDYNKALKLLTKEEYVKQFVKRLPAATTVKDIEKALNSQDYQAAFREAHSLKGVCLNMALDGLFKVSSELTESLRNGPVGDVNQLYKNVELEYNRVCELIAKID